MYLTLTAEWKMNIIKKKNCRFGVSVYLFSVLFVIFARYAAAQETIVSNVTFSDRGDTIVVNYDLDGDAGKRYNIRLSLSDNGGKSFRIMPTRLSGDIGKGVEAGKQKTVVWDMFRDFPYGIIGDNFVFRIDAVYKERSPKFWYYAAGAGTVIGVYLYTRPRGTSTMVVEVPAYY